MNGFRGREQNELLAAGARWPTERRLTADETHMGTLTQMAKIEYHQAGQRHGSGLGNKWRTPVGVVLPAAGGRRPTTSAGYQLFAAGSPVAGRQAKSGELAHLDCGGRPAGGQCE